MTNLEILYCYACDDVRYERKDKPEAWITTDKVNGEMFRSYPLFSHVPGTRPEEPTRYGDFVIDIDTGELACGAARRIVDHFSAIYGIDADQWRIYLSGKKGCHLELPADICGTENGHKWLTLGYKRLALDIEGELGIKLDTSMYNKGTGKPFRQPNIMRDTGTCKRQITYDDLFEISTEEEYRIACSEPGPTWQPEPLEGNPALATKLAAYLKEADKQQESIATAPALDPETIDRLAADIPPCIRTLAGLREMAKGNTFNDIAMQLTAYAVSAGFSEGDFMAGANVFIRHYPSTSLNTPQKREENCRARYRTMAANGNQHSCGGILSLKIPGFDCKECKAMPGGPPINCDVLTDGDIKASKLTLQIPPAVLDPGGLISLGMAGLSRPGMPRVPQYNLPVVLTMIAHAIAGRMICQGVWPNVYNIKVGPTSSGKTSSDQAMEKAITAGINGFYGMTDFSSGPGLMRAVADSPIMLIVLDEATALFKRYEKGDPITDGKRDALLEIFSKSGGFIKKAYSDRKNSLEIKCPCVSLTGNTTTTIFDAIRQEDFDTGTLQRFDFWAYDSAIPERGEAGEPDNPELDRFVTGIAALQAMRPPGNLAMVPVGGFAPVDVGVTDEGREWLSAYSTEITAACNATESDGERGIISRGYHLAIKYAMIHAVSNRALPLADSMGGACGAPTVDPFAPLDVADLDYGKTVAIILRDWKINVLRDKVTTGDFHRDCELFKSAIIAAMRKGWRPTFKCMADRRPHLKNWQRKHSEEVITVLEKRGEVVRDESRKPTAYLIVKQC